MPDALLQVLRDPGSLASLQADELEGMLRRSARAHLTASLGHRLDKAGVRQRLAMPLQDRFVAAGVVAAEHERRLRFGLRLARRALSGGDFPVVVLKGGAYLLAGLPNAEGRLTSDLDLLVPEAWLEEVEQYFLRAGWQSRPGDDYDEHYYREWMHELPPLVHPHHGITIDLHHNLSPRTGRLDIDAAGLFERAVPLDEGLLRLGDEDLVLHLCIHLFHDGEFQNGLRELVDLDAVLRVFAERPDFWGRLARRAGELGLARSLYYGCHFGHALLATPVPDKVLSDLAAAALPRPGRWVIEAAMAEALLPIAGDGPSTARRLADGLLLLRAHWLRMPPLLLLRHLATQVRRRGGLKTKEAAAR
jgi:hypothetical protein